MSKDLKIIKNIDLFLLDMDGTIYLDDELFDGSKDFINKLIKNNKKYVFLTNNSSKSKNDYLNKLKKLNIPCSDENIFTSGMAMGIYLNTYYPNKKVYLVGTKALKNELLNYNINLTEEKPDIVVVGFDRELNYEKLEKACEALDNGAIFLATNVDYVCPIKNHRYIPDCGSICMMITNATGRKPHFIGKPEPDMILLLSDKYKIPVDKIMMIGDRVYTDIKCGFNAKANTCCVLSGESSMETINESDVKPDFIFNSIKDMIEYL